MTLPDLWARVRKVLPNLLDLHLYGGAALVTWGFWQLSASVAAVVAGCMLLGLGIWQIEKAGN